MKSLPNSSPFSSSTTSCNSNNTENEFYDSKHYTYGCIRGVLRRFLCFNSLPTHPSDHFKEASNECDTENCTSGMENGDALVTPGLVARLMGLDSMPTTDLGKLQTSLNAVRRCKSMDFGRENELNQRKGRHVKGTLSFRDVPAYLELENEEFFILSFEGEDENEFLGSKTRKSGSGIGEKKTRRSENKSKKQSVQENNKENQENVGVSDEKKLQSKMVTHSNDSSRVALCPVKNCDENKHSFEIVKKINNATHNKDERVRLRKRKKKKNCSPIRKIEAESDSENTSPVSVLDFSDFPGEFEASSSVQSSRRTLFEELKDYKKSCSLKSNKVIIDELEVNRTEDKCSTIWKKAYQSQSYAEMWGQVCKYAEKDTRQTKWMMMYRETMDVKELEEITKDIGFQILEELLLELLYQVS